MLRIAHRFCVLSALLAAACDPAPESDDADVEVNADAGMSTDSAVPSLDANVPQPDAGFSDASAIFDAAPVPRDAGPADAALDANGGPDTGAAAVCDGPRPHGCFKPKAGNPMGCPPQIHEQSALYPPFEEWEACSSPYYQACIYLRPDGSEANCSCDLGLHWLCVY